jgi:uncharacterized membrane protein
METTKLITLILHITGGYLALTSGLLAMISPKGQRLHRISGSLFYYSMMVVGISSLVLSVIIANTFMFHIGLFVLYQNHGGRKALQVKTLKPDWLDFTVVGIALINGIFMLVSMNIVLLVFGGISLFLTTGDLWTFRKVLNGVTIPRLAWLRKHIGMMIGAYIGTITAFLVVNIASFEPAWLIWLAPTFILVPLMRYWTHKYTKPSQSIPV